MLVTDTYTCTNNLQDILITLKATENIDSALTEGIGISWGVEDSVRPKILKKCMKLSWNFQRGRYGYFLELQSGQEKIVNLKKTVQKKKYTCGLNLFLV